MCCGDSEKVTFISVEYLGRIMGELDFELGPER